MVEMLQIMSILLIHFHRTEKERYRISANRAPGALFIALFLNIGHYLSMGLNFFDSMELFLFTLHSSHTTCLTVLPVLTHNTLYIKHPNILIYCYPMGHYTNTGLYNFDLESPWATIRVWGTIRAWGSICGNTVYELCNLEEENC